MPYALGLLQLMAHNTKHKQLVFTVKDRCRVCYTCVRECPVKAIKIINGQATVISERCIGCGNCVQVCSQGAKVFLRQTDEVMALLKSGKKTVACIAPSFPAEFTELSDYKQLVGMVRALGFDMVTEVGFGADMVAVAYRERFKDRSKPGLITSDCPAIVYYVEHYQPELVKNLAPFVSPMVALSRYLKHKHGKDLQVVFIGPCVAKKAESDEVEFAITFTELREMFEQTGITVKNTKPADFDPPYSGKGAAFSISHGLLQNMDVEHDLTRCDIMVAQGRKNFKDAINEFAKGTLKVRHLELLCCEGCITGPGMSTNGSKYLRRSRVSEYVSKKMNHLDVALWEQHMKEAEEVDLSNDFAPMDRRLSSPSSDKVAEVLFRMGKNDPSDYLNCGACGYDTCIEHANAIVLGLAENEMCLPFAIEKLHQSIEKLNTSNLELANAREALKQSEKLAHMGQLSAGIAHELNNPLGVITMFSNILLDEAQDVSMKEDLELIVEQADRCRKIVGGLLNFARKNQVRHTEVNLRKFVARSLQSIVVPANVSIDLQAEISNPYVYLDTEQMMQVLTNLEKNAVESMPNGGSLTVLLKEVKNDVEIHISDSGSGIPQEYMEKIFTPFFTTKEVGRGTGLGLPLCYGIIKMHHGKINVSSNVDATKGPTGTTFIISIPRNPK